MRLDPVHSAGTVHNAATAKQSYEPSFGKVSDSGEVQQRGSMIFEQR